MADLRKIGVKIGDDTLTAQNAAAAAFLLGLAGRLPTANDSKAFQALCGRIAGDVMVKNMPAFVGTTSSAPNTGDGLDYPEPSIAVQVDGDGNFVTVWWKHGEATTDWHQMGGGGEWASVVFDPSAVGYTKPVKTIVWQVSVTTPVALWAKVGTADTAWAQIWPGTASAAYFHTLVDINYEAMAAYAMVSGDNELTVPGSATGTVTHNVKNWANGAANIVNGQGLTITSNAGATNGYFNYDNSLQVSIPIAQLLTNIDHNDVIDELWLWFYGTGFSFNADPPYAYTSPTSGEEGAVAAFSTWPKDTKFARCGLTHNQYGLPSGHIGGVNQSHKVAHIQSEDGMTVTPAGTAATNNDLVIAIRVVNNFHVQMFSGQWNGGWPMRDQLKVRSSAILGQQVGSSSIRTLWRTGLCDDYGTAAVMTVEGISTSYLSTAIFKRMRVEVAYASKAVPVLLGGSGGGSGDQPFYDVTIVDGVIGGFGTHRNLRVSGTGPLVGVDTTGLGGGEILHLTFAADIVVTGNGSSSGAPIRTSKRGGANWQDVDMEADETMHVQYRNDGGFFKVV